MQEIKNLHEQVITSALLAEMNGKVSASLDSFSGWLLSGFGAASMLFVSQYDSISKHVGPDVIHRFLIFLLWLLGAAIFEKYLAVAIASHSQGSTVGREMGEKVAASSIPLDFEIVLAELEKSILPPMRWLVARSFSKTRKGDFISNTRNFTRLLQVQGLLVLSQVVLIMFAIFKVASAFHA